MRHRTAALWVSCLALLGCAAPAADPVAAPPPPRPVLYDLVLSHGAPFVDLTIGGARGRFLVDTGANISGVDKGWLEAARITSGTGPTSTITGTTGNLVVSTAVLPRMDIGHGFFNEPVFKVQDFSRFAKPGGEPQSGLIGTDFLNCYAITLDFAGKKAAFALQREREPLRDEALVPLDYHLNMPTVGVELAGLALTCRLDTGASYLRDAPFLDVNKATVAALEAAGVKLKQRGTIRIAGVGGSESLSLLEAEEPNKPLVLSVGPARIEGVILVVHGRGTLAIAKPIALAGSTMLARLGRLTIDPFERRLVLLDHRAR